MKKTQFALVSLMMYIAFSPALYAQPDKMIRRAAEPIAGQYIVVLNDVLPQRVADVAREMVLRSKGRSLGSVSNGIRAFAAEMPEKAALNLLRDPRVDGIEENG